MMVEKFVLLFYCFIKCLLFYCFIVLSNVIFSLTGEDYKQQYLDFMRNEKTRSKVMTKARIRPFCRANNNKLGQFNGTRVFPRSVTHRDNALF